MSTLMEYSTIINNNILKQHLDDPDWMIFDCRHDPFDFGSGRQAFGVSHIPNAKFAHMSADLSSPSSGNNGRHPLPAANVFIKRLENWGVDNTKQIVTYDDSGSIYAARLWWMLRWIGHSKVAVLNGGWGHWCNLNFPTERTAPALATTTTRFFDVPRDTEWVSIQTIEAAVGNPLICMIDARSPQKFAGLDEQQDPIGGHIPGALNRFYRKNIDVNGCFLSPTLLKTEFQALIGNIPPENVIHQCGAGITACNNILAMEIAGLHGSKLYPGSWSEWCSNPLRPMILNHSQFAE